MLETLQLQPALERPDFQIYMLTAYTKNERENIDAATLTRIVKQLGELK